MRPEERLVVREGCEDNAAAYVLGALTEDEHTAFHRHLETCAFCREEVAALQVVADALPAVAPPMSVPSELKLRVMSGVQEHASSVRRPAVGRRGLAFAPFGMRSALGLAGLAIVIAAVVVALVSGGGSGSSTRVIKAQVLVPRASVSVRVSGGHAVLNIAGMPQTTPNRVYEVWVKRLGAPRPTDALFTVTSKGAATVGVPGSVAGVKEILVTSEPLGGSPAPTREPVIVASLS